MVWPGLLSVTSSSRSSLGGEGQDFLDLLVAVVIAAPQAVVVDADGLGPVLGVDDRDAAVADHEVIDVGSG
jgi:hypothetical protein